MKSASVNPRPAVRGKALRCAILLKGDDTSFERLFFFFLRLWHSVVYTTYIRQDTGRKHRGQIICNFYFVIWQSWWGTHPSTSFEATLTRRKEDKEGKITLFWNMDLFVLKWETCKVLKRQVNILANLPTALISMVIWVGTFLCIYCTCYEVIIITFSNFKRYSFQQKCTAGTTDVLYLLQGTITAVQKRSYTAVIKNVCLLREKRLIICAETWDI